LSEATESFIHAEVQDFQDLNAQSSPVLDAKIKKGGDNSDDLQHMVKQIKDLDELFHFISWLTSLIKMIKSTPLAKIAGLLNRFFKK